MNCFRHHLLVAALFAAMMAPLAPAAPAETNPLLFSGHLPGFVLLAEQRFDPAVQRYLAEQSLRALPLRDGQLFYIYPTSVADPYVEQMQIRYIQALLDERAQENEPETATTLPTE